MKNQCVEEYNQAFNDGDVCEILSFYFIVLFFIFFLFYFVLF